MTGAKGAVDALNSSPALARAQNPNFARDAAKAADGRNERSVDSPIPGPGTSPLPRARVERLDLGAANLIAAGLDQEAPASRRDDASNGVEVARPSGAVGEDGAAGAGGAYPAGPVTRPFAPGAGERGGIELKSPDLGGRGVQLRAQDTTSRIERARQRLNTLEIQARLAAAAGDSKEAARVARDAEVIAREVGATVRLLSSPAQSGRNADDPGARGPKARDDDGPPADVSEVAARTQAEIAARSGQDFGAGFSASGARAAAAQARALIELVGRVNGRNEKTIGQELLELQEKLEGAGPVEDNPETGQSAGDAREGVGATDAPNAGVAGRSQPAGVVPPPGSLFRTTV